MKTHRGSVWAACGAVTVLLAAVPTARAQDLKAFWKDSLRFETEDGNVKLRIGGRVHDDWAWFDQDSMIERATVGTKSLKAQDGTEFRRARLYLSGEIQEDIEFKFQYDFAGGDADFKDVYVGLTDLGRLGGLRVGQFKEPFSLEELTSSNDITFMERSLLNSLAPSRSTGAMLHDHVMDDRMTWAVGVFRDTNDYGNESESGAYAATGRVTFLPFQDAENHSLVHVGLGLSQRSKNDANYSARPESHLAPTYLSTRFTGNDNTTLGDAEVAGVWGPFSLQGEYAMAMAEADTGSDPDFQTFYVQASYLLTGESRSYDAHNGVFKNPKPATPYGGENGWGAWEVALRYSNLDLDDGAVMGGEMDSITAGVNWYLNNNARVMFNYVRANVDGWDDSSAAFDGDTNIFQIRFQLAF